MNSPCTALGESVVQQGIIVIVTELIVVTGPPGAGKTSVARTLSTLFDRSARVAGDEFFGFLDRGYLAPWTAEAQAQNDIVIRAARHMHRQFAPRDVFGLLQGGTLVWSPDDQPRT